MNKTLRIDFTNEGIRPENMRQKLMELADEDYQLFSSRLLPDVKKLLGVRLTELRVLSKEIAKSDWREFLNVSDNDYFEEVMLKGMVIGCASMDPEERLEYIKWFVPLIDNWSVCDSFCSGLKFTKNSKDRVWEFLQTYLLSNQEYHVRFAVVMLLNYYIDCKYIENVLRIMEQVKHDGYYAKMAAAWAVSVCFIKFPELTTDFLKSNTLDDFTHNKAIQKINESLRVDKDTKTAVSTYRR